MRNIIYLIVGLMLICNVAMAQTTVSGNVSGIWDLQGSPYIVIADISVSVELIIEPGVEVLVQAGGFAFNINGGKLIARGTATDSIYFGPYQGNLPGLWTGIIANNNNYADTLAYCVIRYAVNGVTVNTTANGTTPPVVLEHCDVSYNSINGLLPKVHTGAATAARAQLYVYDSNIHHNGLHGAYIWETAVGSGTAWMTLERCNIYANQSHGVYQTRTNTRVRINNCSIVRNYMDGLNLSSDSKVINTIVAFNYGFGINEENPASTFEPEDIIYNNVWDNVLGDYNNLSGTGFGYPVQTNYNGDSCDVNFNIYMDPLFVDLVGYDYNLTVFSPCIDAGSDIVGGEFIMDPDGTLPDMGALYYNQNPTRVIDDESLPESFTVMQNYPNPFNAGTIIEISLASPQEVSLVIYNTLGQVVRNLIDGQILNGQIGVAWGGDDNQGQLLPSGIYFYQVRTPDQMITKKMVILK